MDAFLYTVVFDLMNLIGVVLSVLPVLTLRHRDVAATVTVGGICEKDTKEIIPHTKWSLTGLVFLVFAFIGKSVFSYIWEIADVDIPMFPSLLIVIIAVIALTVLLCVLAINRYWQNYDWKKGMGKPEQE